MKIFYFVFKVLLFIVINILLAITIYEWWSTTHRMPFTMVDRYQINLLADECGFCFLDWPISYVINIKDLKTRRNLSYELSTGDGPYLNFQTSEVNENLILIRGYLYNGGRGWLIDMNEGKVRNVSSVSSTFDSTFYAQFKVHHALNEVFEITNK